MRKLILILITTLLFGCPVQNDESNEFVISIIYENNAFGVQRFGLLIDSEGHIYQYDASNIPEYDNANLFGALTQAEINVTSDRFTKYFESNSSLIGIIEKQNMDLINQSIDIQLQDENIQLTHACYDSGELGYYFIKKDNNGYSYQKFKQTGDWVFNANDIKLSELNEYLDGLAIKYLKILPETIEYCTE